VFGAVSAAAAQPAAHNAAAVQHDSSSAAAMLGDVTNSAPRAHGALGMSQELPLSAAHHPQPHPRPMASAAAAAGAAPVPHVIRASHTTAGRPSTASGTNVHPVVKRTSAAKATLSQKK
jgi:hypothetical protein